MSGGADFAAEGRGFAKAARAKEQTGDVKAAQKLYMKAAKSFLNASKTSTNGKEKNVRLDMAETFYGKAKSMQWDHKQRIGEAHQKKDGSMDEYVPIEKPDINFADVGGLIAVKKEIKKAIVYPFERPDLYERYGKKAGEGILLYGPPGCGKTFIARAAAGECNASFLSIKSSDVLSKWVGDSEKNIARAFDTARQYTPSILFLDEIDALGGKRSGTTSVYAKRVVNQLLIALDGLEGPTEKLLTLAATNEPWAVDEALRRPGRFSKLIFVPPPDLEARKEIFQIYLKERPTADNVNVETLARLTDGYSSADIAQICSEAADIPLEEALSGGNPRDIEMRDIQAAIEGRKSSLPAWLHTAKKKIKRSGEEDNFSELLRYTERYT